MASPPARRGRFRAWTKKDDVEDNAGQLPPGIDDILGMRGTGGGRIDDARHDPDDTDGTQERQEAGREALDYDLDSLPTAALVEAARKRGVEDAESLDRGRLLERLRQKIQY